MAKKATKKAKARGAVKIAKAAARSEAAKPARARAKRRAAKKALAESSTKAVSPPVVSPAEGKLTFNHAMVYVKDVNRALSFYRDLLGFKLIEDFRYGGVPVYARLRAPGGDGTIALHQAGASSSLVSDVVCLYFEVADLTGFPPRRTDRPRSRRRSRSRTGTP